MVSGKIWLKMLSRCNVLSVQFQSCFVHSGTCGEDKCKLAIPHGSSRTGVYSCCCRSNLCNTRLIYPGIVNSTEVIPDTTTVTTDGTTDQEGTAANTIGIGMREREGGRERGRERGRGREGGRERGREREGGREGGREGERERERE